MRSVLSILDGCRVYGCLCTYLLLAQSSNLNKKKIEIKCKFFESHSTASSMKWTRIKGSPGVMRSNIRHQKPRTESICGPCEYKGQVKTQLGWCDFVYCYWHMQRRYCTFLIEPRKEGLYRWNRGKGGGFGFGFGINKCNERYWKRKKK